MHPVEEREARKGINALVHLAVYLIVGIAIMPQAYVIYTSFKNTQGKIFVDGYSLQSYQTAIGKLGRSIQIPSSSPCWHWSSSCCWLFSSPIWWCAAAMP